MKMYINVIIHSYYPRFGSRMGFLFLSFFLNFFSEPRGFAFVEFVDPYEASEAQYHMNGKKFAGREITVVLAAESRKRPEQMRQRSRR